MKKQWGFTLIEAMVVIAIIGIFASLALPGFQDTINRNKVRKTADLLAQTIVSAKSEALRRNIKTYVEIVGTDICIGTTAGDCDIRKEPLAKGVQITNTTSLTLSPFYGIPEPLPANFKIEYGDVGLSVKVNMLGIVTVGAP